MIVRTLNSVLCGYIEEGALQVYDYFLFVFLLYFLCSVLFSSSYHNSYLKMFLLHNSLILCV